LFLILHVWLGFDAYSALIGILLLDYFWTAHRVLARRGRVEPLPAEQLQHVAREAVDLVHENEGVVGGAQLGLGGGAPAEVVTEKGLRVAHEAQLRVGGSVRDVLLL
jgi:hypothetical protein